MRAIAMLVLVAASATAQSPNTVKLQTPNQVTALAWLPDGSGIVTGEAANVVRVWDLKTRKETAAHSPAERIAGRFVILLSASRDGKQIASVTKLIGLRLWDRTSNQVQTLALETVFPAKGRRLNTVEEIQEIACSGDGKHFDLLSSQGRIARVSVEGKINGEPTAMPFEFGKGETVLIRDEAAVALSGRVGLAYYEGHEFDELRTWDYQQGKLKARMPLKEDTRPTPHAISPDGRWASIYNFRQPNISQLQLIHCDDLQHLGDLKLSKTILGRMPNMFEGGFSPDSRLLAIGYSATSLFDVATQTPIAVWDKRSGILAFSPDSRSLARAEGVEIGIEHLPTVLGASPNPFDLEACWKDLVSVDGKVALRAVYRLADHPAEANKLFAERVKHSAKPAAKDVAAWLKDLDAPAFGDRQAAFKKLTAHAELIESELTQENATNPSPEVVKSVTTILEKMQRGRRKLEGDYLRAYRAVQVLEMMGADGKELLKKYAAGAKGAFLTQEAEWALSRMP